MIPNYFYHGLMKKYVIYFGTLFNDITIERTDEGGTVVQDFLVPIAYGPKQKFIARLEQDPTLNKEIAINLPRISFEIIDFDYDGSRKLPTINKITTQNTVSASKISSSYNPVPYNIKFAMVIYTKNAEDSMKILEQILPYFTPEWTSTLNIIPELNLKIDIPLVLDDVTISDRYEGSYENLERRYIFHTLQFVMKAYFFGPVTSGGIIKRAITNIYNSTLNRSSDLDIISYISNFNVGDEVYQTSNGKKIASGSVVMANSTFIRVGNVLGNFNTVNNLLCSNSNAIGEISNISSSETPVEIVNVRPALTANGKPTSNVDLSINLDDIKSTDDFGISVNITSI